MAAKTPDAGKNDEVRITLRLPADLHAALVAEAEREDRSLNSQIVRLLRQASRAGAALPSTAPAGTTTTNGLTQAHQDAYVAQLVKQEAAKKAREEAHFGRPSEPQRLTFVIEEPERLTPE